MCPYYNFVACYSLAVIPLSSTIPSCNRSSISCIIQYRHIHLDITHNYHCIKEFGEQSDNLILKNENVMKMYSKIPKPFTKSARIAVIKLKYSYHNEIMFRCMQKYRFLGLNYMYEYYYCSSVHPRAHASANKYGMNQKP